MAFLGADRTLVDCPRYSILNWSNYVKQRLNGESDAALQTLERFVNTERGIDPLPAYSSKFHNRPVHRSTLAGLLEGLQSVAGGAPELEALARQVDRLEPVAS
jgi:hypothetical protein